MSGLHTPFVYTVWYLSLIVHGSGEDQTGGESDMMFYALDEVRFVVIREWKKGGGGEEIDNRKGVRE